MDEYQLGFINYLVIAISFIWTLSLQQKVENVPFEFSFHVSFHCGHPFPYLGISQATHLPDEDHAISLWQLRQIIAWRSIEENT